MNEIEKMVEVFVGIIIVFIMFFYVLPKMAEAIGETLNLGLIYVAGVLLVIAFVISLFSKR